MSNKCFLYINKISDIIRGNVYTFGKIYRFLKQNQITFDFFIEIVSIPRYFQLNMHFLNDKNIISRFKVQELFLHSKSHLFFVTIFLHHTDFLLKQLILQCSRSAILLNSIQFVGYHLAFIFEIILKLLLKFDELLYFIQHCKLCLKYFYANIFLKQNLHLILIHEQKYEAVQLQVKLYKFPIIYLWLLQKSPHMQHEKSQGTSSIVSYSISFFIYFIITNQDKKSILAITKLAGLILKKLFTNENNKQSKHIYIYFQSINPQQNSTRYQPNKSEDNLYSANFREIIIVYNFSYFYNNQRCKINEDKFQNHNHFIFYLNSINIILLLNQTIKKILFSIQNQTLEYQICTNNAYLIFQQQLHINVRYQYFTVLLNCVKRSMQRVSKI
ncbi:hypothetical protein pb186bvf_017378 [Paramecium bursaria]